MTENECWLWNGPLTYTGENAKRGYGQFSVGVIKIGAHKFSYMLHFGEVVKGLQVCHSCNNKICVNPKHLHLGTQEENKDEAVNDRLYKHGEHHAYTTISIETARKVREEYRKLSTYADGRVVRGYVKRLAEKYGLKSPTTVNIGKGTTWKYLDEEKDN